MRATGLVGVKMLSAQAQLLCRSIEQYTPDHLIDMLLAAMGGTWWTRDEAITAAARHLGFRRTGEKIRKAFKSAINAAIRRGLLERDGPDNIRRAR
jgi:hypothetical protein